MRLQPLRSGDAIAPNARSSDRCGKLRFAPQELKPVTPGKHDAARLEGCPFKTKPSLARATIHAPK